MPSDLPSMTHRIVTILDIFGDSAEALSIGQVSVRSGLPRSSVHRILQQLVRTRWVEHRDDGYALGRRPFEIGTLIMRHGQVTDAARPLVQQLCARTGHVVHLAVLDQSDVVYLEKAGGPFAGTLPSRVGGRLTAHCTGVGKALLAFAPAAVFDEYLQAGLRRRTSASITSPSQVTAAISEIRDTGYATEREEAVPGVACVAAPVFGPDGAVAAISVCGPRDRIRAADLRGPVTEAAVEISRCLAASSR